MVAVNLIPEALVAQQQRKRRVAGWSVACFASLGVLLIPVTFEGWQAARAEQLRGERRALERDRATVRTELDALSAESRSVYLQLERANALRSKRSWSGMLSLLAGAMPEGCWLTTIETVPAAPPSGAQPAASRPAPSGAVASTSAVGTDPRGEAVVTIEAPRGMRLAGHALDASGPLAFVTRLHATGVFARVGLERSQSEPAEEGVHFRFEVLCEW